jgi:hypothetical protein
LLSRRTLILGEEGRPKIWRKTLLWPELVGTEEVSKAKEELATKKQEQAQLSERLLSDDLAWESQNISRLQAIEAYQY